MKEFLVRIIYAEMLGHDASFGYIQAIQMTASTNLIQKRTGYLCAGLCLHPDHELRFMLVNQLQRVRAERKMRQRAACSDRPGACAGMRGNGRRDGLGGNMSVVLCK
jgi:AP-4 complex subunit epsilon-1